MDGWMEAKNMKDREVRVRIRVNKNVSERQIEIKNIKEKRLIRSERHSIKGHEEGKQVVRNEENF